MPLPSSKSPIIQTLSPTTLPTALPVLCALGPAHVSPPSLSSDMCSLPHFSPDSLLLLLHFSMKCYLHKEGPDHSFSISNRPLGWPLNSSSSWRFLSTCKFQAYFSQALYGRSTRAETGSTFCLRLDTQYPELGKYLLRERCRGCPQKPAGLVLGCGGQGPSKPGTSCPSCSTVSDLFSVSCFCPSCFWKHPASM